MFRPLPRPGFSLSSASFLLRPSLTLGLVALVLVPSALQGGWNEGVEAFRSGNLETALTEFQQVTEARPEFAGGHLMTGQVLSNLKRWSDAARSFARAYELEPEAKPGLVLPWGRALLESEQPEKAVAVLEKLDPGSLDEGRRRAYFGLLSRALMESGASLRPVDRLDRLARSAPDDPTVWQALGHALARADRPTEAARAFERALELTDDPAAARSYVRTAFEAARKAEDETRRAWYGKAAEAAERLVRREPTADHWLLLGEAQLGAARHREAVAAFEKAAARTPEDPLPDYYLGEAFLGLREGDRAEWVLRDALRKSPGPDLTRRIHRALGQAHHFLKEYRQAAREYRAAGDEERAALMDEYQKIADENKRREDEPRKLCRETLAKLEALMADSRDLEGTPEWKQLERDVVRLREACG